MQVLQSQRFAENIFAIFFFFFFLKAQEAFLSLDIEHHFFRIQSAREKISFEIKTLFFFFLCSFIFRFEFCFAKIFNSFSFFRFFLPLKTNNELIFYSNCLAFLLNLQVFPLPTHTMIIIPLITAGSATNTKSYLKRRSTLN